MFRLFFLVNVVLCAVSLAVMIWLSAIAEGDKVPKMREDLYRSCETVFKLTTGAFLGLLAGRGS